MVSSGAGGCRTCGWPESSGAPAPDGHVAGVAMGEVCPLVPIMPDKFDFEREIFTFWATETVWNGPSFFCKIEQRPSFFGKGQRLCWGTGWGIWSCSGRANPLALGLWVCPTTTMTSHRSISVAWGFATTFIIVT